MLNRVILIGRLTRDPELRYTPSGAAVTTFTLAVDRRFTNQQGERETDFIRIVAWQNWLKPAPIISRKAGWLQWREGSRYAVMKTKRVSGAMSPRW